MTRKSGLKPRTLPLHPLPKGQPAEIVAEKETYTFSKWTGKYVRRKDGLEVNWLFVFKRLTTEERSGLPVPDGFRLSRKEVREAGGNKPTDTSRPCPRRGGQAALAAA